MVAFLLHCAQRLQTWLVWGVLVSVLWATGGPVAFAAEGLPSSANAVQVQDGDMASVLAFRLKPRGATIEQMMVALLRLNPDAFIQGNVNLLRDGAQLRLPPAEDVFRIPVDEAKEMVERHHKNFLGDLEGSVAKAQVLAASQPASAELVSPGARDSAADRDALLEKLRSAKAQLSEIQQNIEALERLTQQGEAESAKTDASQGVPNSWIWLGVAAIVAVMIGVGASRRSDVKKPVVHPAPDDAAAQFKARLGALDLDLGGTSSASLSDSSK